MAKSAAGATIRVRTAGGMARVPVVGAQRGARFKGGARPSRAMNTMTTGQARKFRLMTKAQVGGQKAFAGQKGRGGARPAGRKAR